MDQAVARKDSIVKGIHTRIHGAFDRRKNAIDFLRGEARFLNEHEIETGDSRLSFEKAIVATGARIVTTLANEMRRRDARYGLVSICAAGAQACAMILERD